MIDPEEKSTEGSPAEMAACATVAPATRLDGRLAIYHEEGDWLAAADLHFGYEVSRRMGGGLWPLWGMETIRERLASLIDDWKPGRLILVGDIVDSAAAPGEAIEWLESIRDLGPELILVEGNHDRGPVRRHFSFQPHYRAGEFLFHHGHRPPDLPESVRVEITGHVHPSLRFQDGAGTTLRVPAFTREIRPEGQVETWVLPAFSPWAGGYRSEASNPQNQFRRWACSGQRIFEVPEKGSGEDA